jgi:hypothetical protein
MKRFCLPVMLVVSLGCLLSAGCGKPQTTSPANRPPVVQQMNIQPDPEADLKPADNAAGAGERVDQAPFEKE